MINSDDDLPQKKLYYVKFGDTCSIGFDDKNTSYPQELLEESLINN